MDNLAEYLFAHRATALPPVALAEILDRLLWIIDDSGAEIVATAENWLRGEVPEKIAVALSMAEVFPFHDQHEMEEVLGRVAIRFPEFSDQCASVIRRRQDQNGRHG